MTRLCTVGKKIIFTFAIIFILQNKAFTQFEINLSIPIGVSVLFPYAEGATSKSMVQMKPYQIDYRNIEPAFNINTGVLMQIGGSFDLGNETGITSISLLADMGYYLETFGAVFGETDFPAAVQKNIIFLHTLNLGIMPKINIYIPNAIPLSIGLGGGVKIPFSGTRHITMHPREGNDIEEKMSYQDIKETFEYPFIPYIKFTMDNYFYVSESVALIFGLYMSYDFPMKYNVDKINSENAPDGQVTVLPIGHDRLKLTEYGSSSFDIGVTFGVSFGRPDPKPKKEIL